MAEEKRERLPLSSHFIAGAVGGSVAATIMNPLDIIRTRLQSTEARKATTRALRMLVHIVKTEGVFALYRGLIPTVLGVGPSRALYFSSFQASKRLLDDFTDYHGTSRYLIAATAAGIFGNTVMSPWWVIRLRLQLQSEPIDNFLVQGWRRLTTAITGVPATTTPLAVSAAISSSSSAGHAKPYRGIIDAAVRIYREEGIKTFYRGLTASYIGVAETAIQFGLYGWIKDSYARHPPPYRRHSNHGKERHNTDSNSSSHGPSYPRATDSHASDAVRTIATSVGGSNMTLLASTIPPCAPSSVFHSTHSSAVVLPSPMIQRANAASSISSSSSSSCSVSTAASPIAYSILRTRTSHSRTNTSDGQTDSPDDEITPSEYFVGESEDPAALSHPRHPHNHSPSSVSSSATSTTASARFSMPSVAISAPLVPAPPTTAVVVPTTYMPQTFTAGVAFAASAISKLIASAITYPHEVVRTRMREQKYIPGLPHGGLKYYSVVQTTKLILQQEGVKALYGGLTVHLVRTVPNAAIMMLLVEKLVGGEV